MKSNIINNSPLVCVRCMTFNHEAYIEDALNGFIIQQTTFPFVVAIINDASTDKTKSVINEFIENNCIHNPEIDLRIEEYGTVLDVTVKDNPHCIFHIVHLNENHYGKKSKLPYFAKYENAAKYVAMCEGDDYWTDPLKLQKQVDFLEANPEYSLCLTNSVVKFDDREVLAINHIWDTYTIEEVLKTNALNVNNRGDIIVPCGHTSTIFYKKPNKEYPHWISRCFIGDEPLMIYLAHHGKVKFINEITSVYRAGVGVSSKNFNQELDWKNRIKMYEVINEGLGYQYKEIINSIIAQFYFKLCKWNWKRNCKIEAIKFFLHTIKNDYRVMLKKIQNKI